MRHPWNLSLLPRNHSKSMWVQTDPNREAFPLLKDLLPTHGATNDLLYQSGPWNVFLLFLFLFFYYYYLCVCVTECGTPVEVRGQLCSQFPPPAVIWILGLKLRLPGLCGKEPYPRA